MEGKKRQCGKRGFCAGITGERGLCGKKKGNLFVFLYLT